MDRLACVEVTALALQLLLKQHPEWVGLPVAVVDRDLPQGQILQVNRQAWREHIHPGSRYADVLSLSPRLRVGAISKAALDRGIDTITEHLQKFSPTVEPAAEMPGVFWLDASGLTLLYPSLQHWASSLSEDLAAMNFHSTIVVGFSRFATYALARACSRTQRRISVIDDRNDEAAATRRVAIEHLNLDSELASLLGKLGIQTVGRFLELPSAEVRQRLGEQAYRVRRLASGDLMAPLGAQTIEAPITQHITLDQAIVDISHLIFVIKRMLNQLLEKLAPRREAVSALHIQLQFASVALDKVEKTIVPAAATLDASVLLDLLYIALNAWCLPAGIVEIALHADTSAATPEQLPLLSTGCRRNLDAAARAFARLRTELGENSVVCARLYQGHLPEAQFSWNPIGKIGKAHPHKLGNRPLIRRIRKHASPLPTRPRDERNDNWLAGDTEYGSVNHCLGPYIVSGGWWHSSVHREYYFVETHRGRILWLYYDRRRRRWYLHGEVE